MKKKHAIISGFVIVGLGLIVIAFAADFIGIMSHFPNIDDYKAEKKLNAVLDRAVLVKDREICNELPKTRKVETTDGVLDSGKARGTIYDCKGLYDIKVNMNTYSSDKYSFQYPRYYYAMYQGDAEPLTITMVNNENKRLVIFETTGNKPKVWDYDGTPSQEEIDKNVPKEKFTIGTGDKKYDVWLYYPKGDDTEKKVQETIFHSIVTKDNPGQKPLNSLP